MKWIFEPGHTAAEFRARHMMITWVRGSFKNIEGRLEFDPADPRTLAVETTIDASTCWTGVEARDNHLRSADFLHCEEFPQIRFKSTAVEEVGPFDYRVTGDLTIRDVTQPAVLRVRYLGSWETPWWEDGVDRGPKTRAGFVARTQIDRYDFGVNWNDTTSDGGVVSIKGNPTFSISELSVSISGDVAYTHSIQSFSGNMGALHAMAVRVTDVRRKVNGKWLIVQEHVSVPINSATLKPDFMSRP